MSDVTNFGLLDMFKGNDKKEITQNIFSTVGGIVGGSIGKASGIIGKTEGITIGSYLGARTASDSAAIVRAIKNRNNIPGFNNLNIRQKLNRITQQAKENSRNYAMEPIEYSLKALQNEDSIKMYKPFKQAALENAPKVLDNINNMFNYKKNNIKNFNN